VIFQEVITDHEVVVSLVVATERAMLPVEGELVHDELVYVGQGQHFVPGGRDSHGCERDVAVRRLLIAVRVPARTRHPQHTSRHATLR